MNCLRRFLMEHSVFVLFLATLLAAGWIVWHFHNLQRSMVQAFAIDSATLYSQALSEFRSIYTSDVVERLRGQSIEISHDYKENDKAIPLPATLSMELGKNIGKHRSGTETRLYSPYPFPWRKETGGLRDDFAKEAWKHLSKEPDKPFYRFEKYEGRNTLRFATADLMRPSCVDCHNSHPNTPRNDWMAGDLRGILEIIHPVDSATAKTAADLKSTIGLVATLCGIGIFSVAAVVWQLKRTSRQLIGASRQAGMAEVATGVLHNVGNVLNSVNVSSTLISERLRRSRISNLNRIATILRENESDLGSFMMNDRRGQVLPAYLSSLSEHIREEEAQILGELDSLTRNVGHIKDIIGRQQSYAKVSGVLETSQVSELVEDALRISADSLKRHNVKIECEYGPVPPILVDKHKVLQILVNLINNAEHAMSESERNNKRLNLRVGRNGGNFVRITVGDNGIGIKSEKLTEVFSHGFTTKPEGHGFGLHSGANAAIEMGGSLTVHSEGTGGGATFVLDSITSHR